MRRSTPFLAAVILSALMIAALLSAGCGEDTQKMQAFVDGYIRIVEQLESKPEVAEGGRVASTKYAMSGYTDLKSAEKARLSFVESSKNDEAALKELARLVAPDSSATRIKEQLAVGVARVDEGNKLFADIYAKAPSQTVEQRKASATNIAAPMASYAKGMAEVVASLAALKKYVSDNGLEGMPGVKKWYDRIKGELESVKKYVKQ